MSRRKVHHRRRLRPTWSCMPPWPTRHRVQKNYHFPKMIKSKSWTKNRIYFGTPNACLLANVAMSHRIVCTSTPEILLLNHDRRQGRRPRFIRSVKSLVWITTADVHRRRVWNSTILIRISFNILDRNISLVGFLLHTLMQYAALFVFSLFIRVLIAFSDLDEGKGYFLLPFLWFFAVF